MVNGYADLKKILESLISGRISSETSCGSLCKGELQGAIKRIDALGEDHYAIKSELDRVSSQLKRLMEVEFLYREVFEKSVLGIMIVSVDGRIMNANNSMENLLGYQVGELLKMTLKEISLPDDLDLDRELQRDLVEGRRIYYNVEKRYIRNDGILCWGLLSAFAVHSQSGDVSIINMIEDISARKSAEMHLRHASTHDSLTGLYNRAYFDSEFNRLQFGMYMPVSIVVVDVDGLKQLNDTKGHAAGDLLIIAVAAVLKEAFRGDDILARIGGDEFAALLMETGEDAAEKVMKRIRKCQARYNSVSKNQQIEFSIGVATAFNGSEIEQAMKTADARMYAKKLMHKAEKKELQVNTAPYV